MGYNRYFYVAAQGMGSHHVHGTWSALLFHYIEEQDGRLPYRFAPRGNDATQN
jgi:hypothetical protein